MEEMRRRNWVIALIIGIIIGSIVGGIFGTYLVFQNPTIFPWAQVSTTNDQQKEYILSSNEAPSIENAIVNVVTVVSPSVVRIVSTKEVIDFFFLQTTPQQGLGSGVIIESDGLILTNYHVIEDADKIEVTLSSGKIYKGTVIGADPISDVALVQIDEKNLPTAKLSDSAKLKVGQFVVAIGNPYGLDHTVTTGVISALERNINIGRQTMYGIIQTDAAINPGNSGGPLVNLEGEVVGINTLIYSQAQGLGFAVSTDTCKKVIDNIKKTGKMEWPYIGIELTTMTEELANNANLKYAPGIVVIRVMPGSPAENAGIKQGDIIVSIDGVSVDTTDEFLKIVRSRNAGDSIMLEVKRKNISEVIKLELTLSVQPPFAE
ncbi:MAG: trypsin-like peptidase domain-containing protein [Caldisericota bacterium]|nr:trypsin-like peptidase domain-containing protein [Caldisericota bacterium]